MENWRYVVSTYPENPEPQDYGKALRSAETILLEDLASFEIEWLAQTLLFKPVGLFAMITTNRAILNWRKVVADSFKILAKIVQKYWDVVESYYEEIIELCMLSFDAQTWKEVIHCLQCVVKNPSVDVRPEVVRKYISDLQHSTTCKAALAQLVGTFCRHHPSLVESDVAVIWRTCQNMLRPTTTTDQVINSVLQAINGLLEQFGDSDEITDRNTFYDTMKNSVRRSKCLEGLLAILKQHAGLFEAQITQDIELRMNLWQIQTKDCMDALSSVYKQILSPSVNSEALINSEILPRVCSESYLVRQTAMRILIEAGYPSEKIPGSERGVELELQLRTKKLSYEEANTVSWCVNSKCFNSKTMLLTAIRFCDNLPSSKKRDIIVNGVLKASDDVRKTALVLLLNDLDKYIDIWRVLLDTTIDPDQGKAVVILNDTIHYILGELVLVIEDSQKVYSEARPILSLMGVLLSLQKKEAYTSDWCRSLKPSMVHLAKRFGVDPVKMLTETPENKIICVEKFEEDTVLSELIGSTANKDISRNGTLSDFHMIFSRRDTDLKVLSKVLSKIELLIETENNNLDKRQLSLLINHIMKLKSKTVSDSKDARIFQKDAKMFLGKYGHLAHKECFSEDLYVLKLNNKVTLNIPNIIEGTTYKIDLERIFQLCLLWGDTEVLYTFLVILTANLCERMERGAQEACVRAAHALLACGDSEEVHVGPALLMCHTPACVQAIMKCITDELCPKVRRKLSECLEALLIHEPGSETTVQLLSIVAEQAVTMTRREEASSFVSGCDITRAFLAALRENNALTISYISDILINTTNTEIFDIASTIFIEKIDILSETHVQLAIEKIIEKYSKNIYCIDDSNVTRILKFSKNVFEIKKYDATIIVDDILDLLKLPEVNLRSQEFLNLVTMLALMKTSFDLNTELREMIVNFKNGLLLEEVFKIDLTGRDDFENMTNEINVVLVFLREYADEINEAHYEKTFQCLSHIIEYIPKTAVILLKQNLNACLSVYYTSLQKYPEYYQMMTRSYNKWHKKLDLQILTEHIADKTLFQEFSDIFSDTLHALKIMSELIGVKTFDGQNWTKSLIQDMTKTEMKLGRLFVSDLLVESEKTMADNVFEKNVQEHYEFVKNYIGVYFERLICNPYFALNSDNSCLVVEIVEYFANTYKEDKLREVLDFLNTIWLEFESHSSFDQKLSVLLNLLRLPRNVGLECSAVRWAVTLLTAEGTKLEDKIKLVSVLPAGEEYSGCYRSFASYLPVRLSEILGQLISSFRALLDSLAANGDMTLLDIVITLAGGDDTKGWWDHAIEACMKTLAAKEDAKIFDKAYEKTKSVGSLSICNRIFLPLLRHTSRKFCEQYMTSIVSDLFSTLSVYKEPAKNDSYRKLVVSYAVAFNIIKIAFEKISLEGLENGIINVNVGSTKSWHFLEKTCMYCVTISGKVICPSNATDELRKTCLWLQAASYNCLTTAISRRKLNVKLYKRIFNAQAWEKIVDKDAVYPFELQAYKYHRSSTPAAKRPVEVTGAFTGTVRTRLFLRTLSENPLQYDMIPAEEEDNEEDETSIEFEDSVLNGYGCLSTLTALLQHASKLEYTGWRDIVIEAITSDIAINAKWLLAQAICHAEEELKPHAGELVPALFQFIAQTPAMRNEKKVLNNLHIDILSTIIKWNITDLAQNSQLDTAIEYFICSCLEDRHQESIQKRLLYVLNGILQLYGSIMRVKWEVIKGYRTGLLKYQHLVLQILEGLLKNGVALPDLLEDSYDRDCDNWTPKMAEVYCLAFLKADQSTRDEYFKRFRHVLDDIRINGVEKYVQVLFYAQRSYPDCCSLQDFTNITQLTNKVTRKSTCLSILATYLENATEFNESYTDMFQIVSLSELFETSHGIKAMVLVRNGLKFMDIAMKKEFLGDLEQYCKNSSTKVRKEAYSVVLKAFQDLVKRDGPENKRRALDSTPILDIIDSTNDYEKNLVKQIFEGLFDRDEQVSKMMADGIEECLSKDITVRFAELFYIIVYQCSLTKNDNLELSNCGAKLLGVLFSDLRSQDAFKVIKLRDEGLPEGVLKAYEVITTQTYARTFQRSSVIYRQRIHEAPARRDIDVQMLITDIIEVFIKLSKINSEVCQELCVQIMRCLQGTGRRFDLDSVMAKQLCHIMKLPPYCLTPLVLDACRIFVIGVSRVIGFKESVEGLKQLVFNSEGYLYTNILYEDLLLRTGDRKKFILGMVKEETDATMGDQEFSVEGLINVFGLLSNWDDLRLQDRRQIEDSLPPLWTKDADFEISLKNYFERANGRLDYNLWFNKMVSSYCEEEATQDRVSWLKQTDKWPRRDFVTSAVIEAIQWHQNEAKIVGDMNSSDCLAEWAARLMIRSAYNNQNSDSASQEMLASGSRDELVWCREANRRSLPNLALQCIRRNKDSLLEYEVVPWIQEKVKASRSLGLKENNLGLINKALDVAEKQTLSYSLSSLQTDISMQKLILQLNHDLGSLPITKLDDVMQKVRTRQLEEGMLSSNDKQVLKCFYESAMVFYDELWIDNDETTQNVIITRMCDILNIFLENNLPTEYNLLSSMLLNKIVFCPNMKSMSTANTFLKDECCRYLDRLDFFSIATLKKAIAMLPATFRRSTLDNLQESELDVCKEYFQLICDVNYSLLHYCEYLRRNISDVAEWRTTFDRMKMRLFESKYGGSDFQSLNTLKIKLYALENMTDLVRKENELKSIIEELRSKSLNVQRPTLLLSQLCPDLCKVSTLDMKKTQLQKLLRLPPNVYVVKFDEQISVFNDSVRRPCVLKALLSNGITRKYIIKSGEPLLRDAAVQRAAAILPAMCPELNVRSYNRFVHIPQADDVHHPVYHIVHNWVTPLSDDSAIIEYLEDHVRLRDLMAKKHNISNISDTRPAHDRLITAHSQALEEYNSICNNVPFYILRSSIESNCSNIKEFIVKKRTFEDTLSSMTILNWLFGVGDRHLNNIMYSLRDGSVCGVDWASIFQYGCRELPPARLTANLLAVCDVKVLESRLQTMLSFLRDNKTMFIAFIKTSFYWLGPEFKELKHIENILEGKSVSYGITREIIDESDMKNKNEYIKLLDQVFKDFTPKETYSVEEQVACLLKHCTDPRILAVTPAGWEAWL